MLFASAVVDYDYIMGLLAGNMQNKPAKQKMTMEQIIDLLASSANLMDERDELVAYIKSLQWNKGRSVDEIKDGYEKFKEEKLAKELADIAAKHQLPTESF